MKKILFLLLTTVSIYAQVGTGQEQEFDYGIKNNSAPIVPTPNYLTTSSATGVYGKIEPINLQISTATQNALDAKQIVFTGIDQAQFLTENDIVIDNTALTLTIATVKNGGVISTNNPVIFYTDGNGIAIRHVKTAPVVFTFTNTTGIWYFYFDSTGSPIASQTAPSDSSTIARVYRIYWNSALAVEDKRVIESLEVYKNDATWVDRDWKDTQGAQYSSGFTISSNVLASGTPAIDGSNAVVNLTSGTIIDANLAYTLTNAATGTTKFSQNLGSGLLPATSGKFITITNNASLILDKIPATDFPFLWNATTNTPEYLTQLGVRTGVTANNFFVYYLYAIQDPRRGETIKIKSAEIDFANSSLAEAHSWTQLQTLFPTLRDSKIRVLYKLTFEHKTAFDIGTKKSALRKIDDLRKQRTTSTATVGGVIPASTVTVTPISGISSTNVQLALEELDAEKAPLASPALTGTPTAPTAAAGANNTQIATTAFVSGANFWTNTSGTIRNNNTNEVQIKPLNKVSILNSDATETAKITASGSFISTLAGTTGFFGSDEASGMYQNSGNHLVFRSSQDGFQFEPRVYSGANAAGDIIKFKNGFEFSPTSGTGVFNVLNLTGTINQTGGANGITRGIYINPTLTSAADFRAIDVTAGTILAPSFTKVGGTSSQFLKADGSSDATVYATGTGGTGYIQNQNSSAQSANMWISGTAKFGSILTDSTGGGYWQSMSGATNRFIIGSDNNVGGGSINDLSYYSYNGIHRFYQAINGTGATFSSTVTASNGQLIGGTGASGYLPKWTGTGTQGNSAWQESATGGRLFDGTDDGVNKLQVNGRIRTLGTTGDATIRSGNYTWLGGSGGDYGSVGYNVGYKSTSGTYDYVVSDHSSLLRFDGGGFRFYSAPSGIAGNAITYSQLAELKDTGVLQINNLSGTGTRTVVADASGNLSATNVEPASGSYTPTLASTANCSSLVLQKATYTKVGSIVTVYIFISGSTTSINTLTSLTATLPFSKATATSIKCGNFILGTSGSGSVAFGHTAVNQTLAVLNSYTTGSSGSNFDFVSTFQYNIND